MRYSNNLILCRSVLLSTLLSLVVTSLADGTRTQAQTTSEPQITVGPTDQPVEPQIAIRSDTQEVSPDKNLITASGNVFFLAPAQRIEATATQVQYFRNEQRVVLTGNVSLKQPDKNIKADKVVCLLGSGECNVGDAVPSSPMPSKSR